MTSTPDKKPWYVVEFRKMWGAITKETSGFTTEKIEDLLEKVASTTRAEAMRECVEVFYDFIGKHNAKILNEFQMQGKPDMPFIAYDERACLIPAMTKACENLKENIALSIESRINQ